jgi:hypothetical protein
MNRPILTMDKPGPSELLRKAIALIPKQANTVETSVVQAEALRSIALSLVGILAHLEGVEKDKL